jgi:hypothetical protein
LQKCGVAAPLVVIVRPFVWRNERMERLDAPAANALLG